MRERRSGTIVNVGSIAGWEPSAGVGIYSASKFAVAGLSEVLKNEVEQFVIEVHCIEPGYFATSLLTPSNLTLNKAASIKDYEQLNGTLESALQNVSGN